MQIRNKLKSLRAGELIIFAGLILLVILYLDRIAVVGKSVLGVIMPLLSGVVLAYILNLIVKLIESVYFPKTKKAWLIKTRRPASIVISIFIVMLLIAFVMALIIPQFVETIRLAAEQAPLFYEKVLHFIELNIDLYTDIQGLLPKLPENPGELLPGLLSGISGGVLGLAGSALNSAFDMIVSIIFALYLLAMRDTLMRQAGRLIDVYVRESRRRKLYSLFKTANETFSRFFAGQAIEAVVLGTLCTIGMLIFRLPYALMIGSLVGVTALIPLIGAYIGGAVGFIIIFPESIYQAVGFVIFLVILQQLEGNLIYPRVVGQSVGLPGIWVFAAVIVGGGLFGIAGVLFGVPVAATFYKLIRENISTRSI
jgi:predicted PurR-regulated permease PerM